MAMEYTAAYLQLLDAVYKKMAVTSVLEANAGMVRPDERNPKVIYTRSLAIAEGLATYSRDNGYDDTTAEVNWESHTFSMDRGKMFDFDAMDEVEAMSTAAELAAEFYRLSVVPEIDAYRWYKIYAIKTAAEANADITTGADLVSAIDTATETMDDNEVPEEGRLLFLSNGMYNLIKNGGTDVNARLVTAPGTDINRNVTSFDNMPIYKMPKSRFSTTPVFSATNGFTAGGYYLNFAILRRESIIAIIKHLIPKLIDPRNHQTKDAWRAAIRCYHDLFIPKNKKNGIYLHRKTTGI
jgi:hypothetical protein